MTKIRKSIIAVLACVFMLALCAGVLAACANDTYTVTFMVRENGTTGNWRQYTTVETNDDGSVTLPADPTVEGYTFRDWYTDEDCTEVFDETSVSGDTTVYALFAENNVTLYITDGEGVVTQTSGSLAALDTTTATYEEDALSVNLTFDGWYTNAAFTQKYSSGMDATALYGRYMAAVTIGDGYNDNIYTEFVTPGTAMDEPADDNVLQYYMGEIVYYTLVDSDGNIISKDSNGAAEEFDFSTEIDVNTNMLVMWASPDINYELNSSTGGLIMNGFTDNPTGYPVVSIPAYATYNGSMRLVESVIWTGYVSTVCPSATKIIFADGIKYISGVNGFNSGIAAVQEIVLPDTLKIVDTAFNNLTAINGFDIPDGTEIILNSFWGTYSYTATTEIVVTGNYSFNIQIPSSVINISRAPSNFVYADGSDFWYDKDTDATYKKGADNDYETLISMYNFGTIANVKEGVEYVHVGAFLGMDFDYLYLPDSFKGVAYNENAEQYEYYTNAVDHRGAGYGNSSFSLYTIDGSTTRYGIAFVDTLNSMERVIIDLTASPSGLSNYAIQGWVAENFHTWYPYTSLIFDDEDKVVFTGEIDEGETVTVKVRTIYDVTGSIVDTVSVPNIASGGKLTEQAILDAIDFDSTAYTVVSITQFGEDYFASVAEAESGKTVTCRQYIEVVYSDNPGGAVIEIVNGIMTVTDFDASTAFGDSNSGYIVTIPETYEGLTVTAIAVGAFKGIDTIVTVNIPSSITTIGDEAFKDTVNLTLVNITPGGLSVIGRSAFENSGFTSIALPLENLTDVGAYAFKSEKLQYFTAADGETPLTTGHFIVTEDIESDFIGSLVGSMLGVDNYIDVDNDVGIGAFGFIKDGRGYYIGLFKYMGSEVSEISKGTNSTETEEVTVYNVQLIAVAGGSYSSATSSSYTLSLGLSYRDYYYEMTAYQSYLKNAVVSFEIIEGSVYYLDGLGSIVFGIVSYVHEDAFTDIDVASVRIYINTEETYDDTWLTTEDFYDSEIFENGWWEGMDTSSDEYKTFVESITEYGYSLH